jgi:hypothetical protein
MKLALPCIALLAALSTLSAENTEAKPDGTEDVSIPDGSAAAMKGTYVGAFGKHKITICLDRVIGATVSGYSIVAGNERAFSGSFEAIESGFKVVAKEPGDHAEDGVFAFNFKAKPKAISGVWVALDKKIGKRDFNLPAKVFKYNPKAGKYPKASTSLLKERDVENMKPEELRIMRNEIFARHGYSFKLADMREHFEAIDWYMPMAVDITTKLTENEKKNAALIKRYEKYSAEYYDSFGR